MISGDIAGDEIQWIRDNSHRVLVDILHPVYGVEYVNEIHPARKQVGFLSMVNRKYIDIIIIFC